MLPAAAIVAVQLGQVLFPTPADEGIKVTHDYTADLAALAPTVPPEQRAWLKYLVPYGAIRCVPDEVADMPRPGDKGWDRAAAYCRQNRKWFAQIRAAAAIPMMGYPLSTQSDPDARRLPPCSEAQPEDPDPPVETPARVLNLKYQFGGMSRGLTRLLWCDTMLAAMEDDGNVAGSDLRAMMGLSRHVAEQANSTTELISMAIAEVMFNALRYLLETKPALLPTEDLLGLMDDLVKYPAGGRTRPRLDFERATLLDEMQRAYSDDGKGDGRLTANGIRELDRISETKTALEDILRSNLIFAGYFWSHVATRAELLTEFDARTTAPEYLAPLWGWTRWPDEPPGRTPDQERDYKTRFMLLGFIMPDLRRMALVSEATMQRRDAARSAIAIELFRRKNGVFPKSLNELAPAYLGDVPPDRFTGEPLCYMVLDGRAIVYSRGPNLKDDHARASEEATDQKKWRPPRAARGFDDPAPDGDWILFEIKP